MRRRCGCCTSSGCAGGAIRWRATLPMGEQRRLEIGRALATQPKLLLLDEPTAGMNPHETTEMMGFIQECASRFGITILLIEHQMRVVMSMSDRVSVLDHGVKIAEGRPAEVQRDPSGDRGLSGRDGHGCADAASGSADDHGAARNRRHPRLLRQDRGAEGDFAFASSRAGSSRWSAATAPANRRR